MSKGSKNSSSNVDQDDLLALQHEHYVKEVRHSGVSTWAYDQYPGNLGRISDDDHEALLDRDEDIMDSLPD